MAYNSIEKKRLEEYKKILSMAEKKESSINMPLPTNVPGGTNYLPTRSGQMSKQVKLSQPNNSNKVGATLGNLGLLLGKGAVNKGEGILDFLNNMTAKTTSKAFELIGRDDLAQKETDSRRNFVQRDLTQELGTATGASQQITKNEQNGSLLTRNNLGGQIVQAVGGQLPTLAIGALTGVGGLNNAIGSSNMGLLGKVGTTALINAPTNAMLASSSYGGALQEAYLNGATEAEATKYAIGSTAVEIASEWITGGIPGTGGKGGIDVFADKGIDKISNKLVQDLVRYGYKMVGEGVEEGIAEIMAPILKNATYTSGEKINWQDVLNSAIVGGISAGIIEVPSTVSNISNDIRQNKNNAKLPTVSDLVKQEQSSNINSNQVKLPTVNDIAKNSINTNEKINQSLPVKKLNFIESARKYNIDTNNDTIRSINKTLSQRNINASWDDTIFKSNKQNALWKLNSDGTREIIFNPKAETGDLLQNVAVHELYHDLTTSQNSNVIKNEILEFAKTKEGYQEARLDLEKTYSEIYDKNSVEFQQLVDEEVVASILGNKLGDQQFISQLTMQKPSLARQIYNWIVDKLNTLNKSIGYKSERLFWEDIKNKFENAYREKFNGSTNINEKYSTIGPKGAKNLAKNSNERRYNQLYAYLKTAKDIAEQNKGKSLETRNIETKKQTQWYQTKYDDWATMISDKDARIIKQLEPNKTYKLGEVLKHDLLYQAYPGLENLNVKTVDSIKTTAGLEKMKLLPTNVLTTEILLKNSDINKKDFRKSILHEVNHFIQGYEKFNKNSRGASSSKMTIEEYRNNLGEIISNEAKILSDLTQEKLDNIILFEQGKSNPQDKNIRKALDLSNKMDRSDLSDNINTSRYSTQNKNQVAGKTNIKNDRNNRLKNIINDEGLDNSSFSLKQKQLDIILKNNPVYDDYHTWIRTVDDIKTFEETLEDTDYKEYYEAGEDFDETYSAKMAKEALSTGKITVYSSYPIEQGIFVSPSRMEAESYSGNGKVYSKEVNLTDIAWIDPTQGQYAKVSDTKYSQNSGKWKEYLDKYYKREGNGKTLNDLKLLMEEASNVDTSLSNLSNEEIQELYILRNLPFDLGQQEIERLEYLQNKEKGYSYKFPELKKTITYDDIKGEYAKYKNLKDFNPKLLKTAESFVTSYRNTGKRTKQQWLNIANFIGSNIKTNSSEELTKYAIQSWFSAKPNTKETLNRQGEKYVKFTIDEWVNEVYKSAGVGTLTREKVVLPVKSSVGSTNKSETYNKQLIPIDNSKIKKVMNPLEISKMTKEDANTTPILPNIRVSTGDGESKFVSNIRNKTDMLSESSKDAILSSDDVKFYEKVTNKESLEKAFERLNKNGKTETLNWINKKSENATDVDVAEGWILLKQYQDKIAKTDNLIEKDNATKEMVQVAKKLREIGTKAGQTVQAFNILNRLTPEGMVYYAQSELFEAFEVMSKNKTKEWIDSNKDKFELTQEETQFIMDTMQEVQKMEDGYDKRVKLAEIQKVMTDKLPSAKGVGIKTWMRISMLFNPKTQVRNVVGNAIIAPVNYFSDLFAGIVDKQVAKQTGIRTTGNTNLKNYGKGFKTGLYQSYNDFKKGINTRNIQGNRFEISEGKSFNDKTVIGKTLNKVDEFLSFVLDAGDRGFYEASFTNSINNQMILNNTTEVTQDMIDIATSEALSRTWQDNNAYSASVLAIRNILNGKIDFAGIHTEGFRYGLGDILIPFAKTPANLTKAIIDYSPAGLVKTIIDGNNLRKSLSNGQYNVKMQHQFVQELGKAIAGTMLYVLGYALAKAGVVSGESDEDKDVANFLKNTLGISSYSIKIGNKSFTYDWAQPIAAPLSIMANVVNSKNKETALLEGIVGSLDTAGSVLLEQSFLQSINDVLNSNDGVVSALMTEILELPSRAIPTLSKQIADMVDGTQRTTFEYGKPIKSAYNYAKSKIPFISKSLQPNVDTIGREIQKYGGKNNIFNVFFNPANVNTENISESAKEIYRLYKETGKTNIMPRVAPYHINKNNEKVILSSQQRTEYQKVSGKIIEDNIQKLLNTIEYKNMSNITKAEVISEIVNYSYNIAQKEILGTELSDKYQKAYEYSQIGDISDYYSFKASIDDTNKDTKKESISNYLINSNLKNNQIAYLYGGYYSSEKTLNSLLNANVPIKEFIKFNSQEFTTNYYDNGKAITNSRKNKVIKYINSLNLSIPQKAILIKMEYNSYDNYNSQIVNYINKMNYSKFEKASLLKSFGFDNYDKYLVSYINNMNLSKEEKTDMLEELGFTIRNGRVYR